MDKKNMTEYIKVNLPLTEQDYLAGNGEGVWVLVDPKTKQAHDTDATGGGYVGILDNDSCYYPGLNAGQLIPFELRGSYRPVANFYSFLSKLPRLTQMEKARILDVLISNYNDGRKKTLFCVAVNLLELQELQAVLREIECKSDMEALSLKEKSAFVASLLQDTASRRKIDLKLHKKK